MLYKGNILSLFFIASFEMPDFSFLCSVMWKEGLSMILTIEEHLF